jgi:hypothetical protein
MERMFIAGIVFALVTSARGQSDSVVSFGGMG